MKAKKPKKTQKEQQSTHPCLGWRVPIANVERFKAYCDLTGDPYVPCLAAAMLLWEFLPPKAQRQLRLWANQVDGVPKDAGEQFLKGVLDGLENR